MTRPAQQYTPAVATDIRKTWAKHWPRAGRDAVYRRVKSQALATEPAGITRKK